MIPPDAPCRNTARPGPESTRPEWWDGPTPYLLAVTALTLLARLLYLATAAGRIGSSDEAVFGMMAERIMALEEFPIYLWGAHYAGAPVSYVAAVIFKLTGPSFVALRVAMVVVAVVATAAWYVIYRRILGDAGGLLGAATLIFCPVVVLHHTMAAYGGYGETYLGIALIILLAMAIEDRRYPERLTRLTTLLGFTCGFFFYVMFLIAPAIVAFALPPLWNSERRWRNFGVFAGALVVGASPMIVYNLQTAGATVLRAAGRSTGVGFEIIDSSPGAILGHIASEKIHYLGDWLVSAPGLLGTYVVPEVLGNVVGYTAGVLLGGALVWFTTLAFKGRAGDVAAVYASRFAVFLVLLLLFQWAASLTRARHLLPLLLAMPVAMYPIVARAHARRAFLAFGVVYCALQLVGWHDAFGRADFDGAPAAAAMQRLSIDAFYGSYWSTYSIMFADRSDLAGAPYLLPFNTPLTDRTPEISARVVAAPSPAFVFGDDETVLRDKFEAFLAVEGLDYRTEDTGGVRLYFDISRAIDPVVEPQWNTGFALR